MPNKLWIVGNETAAPAAATQLLKITPTIGKIGVVYGYHLTSQEASAAGKVARLRASIAGVVVILETWDIVANMPPLISDTPLAVLRGNGIDFYEIINVLIATAATIYRPRVLYNEYDSGVLQDLYLPTMDRRTYPLDR